MSMRLHNEAFANYPQVELRISEGSWTAMLPVLAGAALLAAFYVTVGSQLDGNTGSAAIWTEGLSLAGYAAAILMLVVAFLAKRMKKERKAGTVALLAELLTLSLIMGVVLCLTSLFSTAVALMMVLMMIVFAAVYGWLLAPDGVSKAATAFKASGAVAMGVLSGMSIVSLLLFVAGVVILLRFLRVGIADAVGSIGASGSGSSNVFWIWDAVNGRTIELHDTGSGVFDLNGNPYENRGNGFAPRL